jgi:hypothetical protein
VMKGCNVFMGQQLAYTSALWAGGRAGALSFLGRKKTHESRRSWTNPLECVSGGDPLLVNKILHLPFFPSVRILCELCLES